MKCKLFSLLLAGFAVLIGERALLAQSLRPQIAVSSLQTENLLSAQLANNVALNAVYSTAQGLLFRTGDEQKMLHVAGRILSAQPSPDRQFLAVLSQENRQQKTTERELTVFTATGELRYRKMLAYDADDPLPVFAVRNTDGAAVLAFPATSDLQFVDQRGATVEERRLFPEAPYALEKGLCLAFSGDGRYIAVAAMREPARPGNPLVDRNVQIFLFEANGTLLWQKPILEQALQALAIPAGRNGAVCAVATYDPYSKSEIVHRTRLFSANGSEIMTVPHGFRQANFDETAQTVLLVDKKHAWQYDLTTKAALADFHTPDDSLQIVAIALHPSGKQSAILLAHSFYAATGFGFRSPRLVCLDERGQQIFTYVPSTPVLASPYLQQQTDASGIAIILQQRVDFIPWIEKP